MSLVKELGEGTLKCFLRRIARDCFCALARPVFRLSNGYLAMHDGKANSGIFSYVR